MCNCGCNTCETKGPLLTEGKVKSLLSEGLQYHIDKKIPLFETVYRIGSDKHMSLIKEARKMYSRNIIDLCEDDEALIKTHLGEFALYEGESVPLDLPMLNEANKISDDKLMRLISKMPKGYVGKNTGIGKYTILTPDGKDIVLTQSKDKKNWSYEPSNVALKILNETDDREDDELSPEELANKYAGSPFFKENLAQTLAETIKLGEGVIEEELCPKGKAYIKRRKAAGEKSSAYLSGRAVKVCKGQMSGRKKRK